MKFAVPSDAQPLQGRHVLIAVIAFFGVVFAVNGYFLYSALSTYTGVVANEPYRKGLAYNERIAADERQAALGWKDVAALTGAGHVSVVLTSAVGPVSGLVVSATLGRPANAGLDRTVALKEAASGTYAADVGGLPEGNWILAVEARQDASGEPVFRSRHRLMVKP